MQVNLVADRSEATSQAKEKYERIHRREEEEEAGQKQLKTKVSICKISKESETTQRENIKSIIELTEGLLFGSRTVRVE